MANKMVVLETYKVDTTGAVIDGEGTQVQVSETWLKNYLRTVGCHNLEEFLNEYTYDEVEHIYPLYRKAMKQKLQKLDLFIEELDSLKADINYFNSDYFDNDSEEDKQVERAYVAIREAQEELEELKALQTIALEKEEII